MKRLVFFTGAGISEESGVKTFRDSGGLWEGHDVMEVASIQGWHSNKKMVLDFYNQRRRQLHEVKPNAAHVAISELQAQFEVIVITQNVDDLHERAGSKNIIHLHGELMKSRSEIDSSLIYERPFDINLGDTNEFNHQLRPHIVWFGEAVNFMEEVIELAISADIFIVVGTSLQVFPAAGIIDYLPSHIPLYYIDPKPAITSSLTRLRNAKIISEKATIGMKLLIREIID
ncbi:MAG: NAD-dependent deacylase [Saprospiraceae bacterium]|nr:NAD-dependent deacylase [Saprospiraceae bacterium]